MPGDLDENNKCKTSYSFQLKPNTKINGRPLYCTLDISTCFSLSWVASRSLPLPVAFLQNKQMKLRTFNGMIVDFQGDKEQKKYEHFMKNETCCILNDH